jgi:hypothetical protein
VFRILFFVDGRIWIRTNNKIIIDPDPRRQKVTNPKDPDLEHLLQPWNISDLNTKITVRGLGSAGLGSWCLRNLFESVLNRSVDT